uniref:Uncharacterized protein n=1 Tax=Lotus japonicus TaxID=34305 RepID=I3T3B0_LOTJA|nr:unknown [Lotus japonicus]
MLVELGLTVTPSNKLALATTQTLSELTVTMQLTATSRKRVKHHWLVTLQEQPQFLHQIPALQVVPTLQAQAP